MPLLSFDTPCKHLVFWCFQGVSKETSGMKWVKSSVYEFFSYEIKFGNDKITGIDKYLIKNTDSTPLIL